AIASAAAAKAAPFAHLGASFVDVKSTRSKLGSIHSVDCFLGFFVVRHFNKAKASRLASITVFQNRNVVDLPVCSKALPKFVFGNIEIQITYIDVLHAILLRWNTSMEYRRRDSWRGCRLTRGTRWTLLVCSKSSFRGLPCFSHVRERYKPTPGP